MSGAGAEAESKYIRLQDHLQRSQQRWTSTVVTQPVKRQTTMNNQCLTKLPGEVARGLHLPQDAAFALGQGLQTLGHSCDGALLTTLLWHAWAVL